MLQSFHEFEHRNVQKLQSFINNPTDSYILITSHKQGDPDSLGSAIICYNMLSELKPELNIEIVLSSINKLTKKIINSLRLSDVIKSTPSLPFDPKNTHIIITDTNSWKMIDTATWPITNRTDVWQDFATRIILDHHLDPISPDRSDIAIIEPQFSSATELILGLSSLLGVKHYPLHVLRTAMFGILVDTKRMTIADGITLQLCGQLLKLSGDSLDYYWNILNQPRKISQRIASLKAGQRSKIVRLSDEWVFAFSHVSSFEAEAARHLLILGADCAAVINQSNTESRISFRSQTQFYLQTQIHCGQDLAIPLAKQFENGSGSGHPTAAGCNLPPGEKNLFFDKIVSLLKQKMIEQSKL